MKKYLYVLMCITMGLSSAANVSAEDNPIIITDSIEEDKIEYTDSAEKDCVEKPHSPEPPVQVDADVSMAEVTWGKVECADFYELQCFADKNGSVQCGETVTTENTYLSFYNLAVGKAYYVRVRAVKEVEPEETVDAEADAYEQQQFIYSDWTTMMEIVTAPAKPASIEQIKADTDSITVKWTGVTSATSYNIYKKVKNKTVLFKNTKDTKIKVTGMTEATSVIVATVKTSESGFSTENFSVLKSDKIVLKPKKVKEINVEDNGKSLLVSVAKKNGVSGFEYRIYNEKNKLIKKQSTSQSTVSVKKPKTNCFYKIKIRAFSKFKGKKLKSSWSTSFYFGGHIDVSIERGKKSGLQINWEKCKGASGYSIYISKDNSNFVKVSDTRDTEYLITKYNGSKIKSGKIYYVYVTAFVKKGNKLYSTCVQKSVFLETK